MISNKYKNQENRRDMQVWIAAFLMFLCANPYFLWHTPLVSVALTLLCIVSFNYYTVKRDFILFGGLFFLIYAYYVVRSDFSFFGSLSVLFIVPFFFFKTDYVEDLYNKFILVLAALLIPSIIQYVLCTFVGISFGYRIVPPYELEKLEMYRQYLFFVETDQFRLMPRFFAYFDEPGVLGTISGMILLSQKFNLKKWYNVVLLIAGILSISMAFFIFAFAGLLLGRYKYKWVVVIGVIGLVITLSQIDYLEPLFMRFTIEDNQLAGDNRTSDFFDQWFSSFMQTPDVWTGKGRGYAAYINEGGSSYKNIIVDYGIIFFIIYITTFGLKALKEIGKSREVLLWMVLFLGCMYQRPSINRPEYVFVWLASIYFLANIKMKNKNEKRIGKYSSSVV